MESTQNEQPERQRITREPGICKIFEERKRRWVRRYYCKECTNSRARQTTYKGKKSWANHYRLQHANQGYVRPTQTLQDTQIILDDIDYNQARINVQQLAMEPQVEQQINATNQPTDEPSINIPNNYDQAMDLEFSQVNSERQSQTAAQNQATHTEDIDQQILSQNISTQDTEVDNQDNRPYYFRYTSKRTYQQRLQEPLCPGSDMSSAQFAYLIMEWKLQHNVSNEATNKLLRMMSTCILPQPNNALHSYKQLRNIVGSIDEQIYERHCCPHNCCTFPSNIDKKDWHQHLNEKCPHCPAGEGYRFTQHENGNIKPNKKFFYYGLSKQIMMQISQPDFQKQYGLFKQIQNDPHRQFTKDSYFRSPEYARMKEATNGEIDKDESLIYDIGYDDLPLGDNFKAGLVFARPFKLPVNSRYKQSFVIPLLFIPMPGKQQNEDDKPNMDLFFQELTEEIYKLGTAGINDQYGKTYKIFIGGIYADWLARAKMFKLMFPSAYRACAWCCIVGEQNQSTDRHGHLRPSGMYFLGYINQTTFRKVVLDQNGQIIRVEDIQRRVGQDIENTNINEEKLMQIMKAVQVMPWNNEKQELIKVTGVKGLPILLENIWYLKYNHSVLLPLGHTILLGLTKQVLNLIFGKESLAIQVENIPSENEINKRHQMLHPTSECKRNTRPVASYYSSYIMEECLDFITTFSCFIFSKRYINIRNQENILPTQLRQLWVLFRKLVIFAFKPKRSKALGYTMEQAQSWLKDIAKELERIGGIKQCTPNLHQICCRFFYQYMERGTPLQYLELWGERGNQEVRETTQYRMSKDPAMQYSKEHASKVSLQEFRVRYECSTFDELQPEYRRRRVERVTARSDEFSNIHINYQNEEQDRNAFEGYFQGFGTLMTTTSTYKEYIEEAIFRRDGANLNMRVLDTLTEDQLALSRDIIENRNSYEIIMYKQCKIDESVVINTLDYKLSNRQNGWFMCVFYQGRGTTRNSVQKICKALQFVMICKKRECFSNDQDFKKQLPLRGVLCQEYTINNIDIELDCLGSPQDIILEQSITQIKPVFIPVIRIQYKCARYQDKQLGRSFFIYIDKEYDNNLGQGEVEDDEDEFILSQLANQQFDNS